MNILGYKSAGHDGSLCYVEDGRLVFSIEGEKDGRARHALLDGERVAEVVEQWRCEPHVLCGDGREFGDTQDLKRLGTDFDCVRIGNVVADAASAPFVSVTQELAHIACGFALSDLPERQPFYALVWDGLIGNLYHVDAGFRVTRLGDAGDVLDRVGLRYCLPFEGVGRVGAARNGAAARVMALSAFGSGEAGATESVRTLVNHLLDARVSEVGGRWSLDDDDTRLYQAFAHLREEDETHPEFTSICSTLHEGIFERFRACAAGHAVDTLPLIISGGCGLNSAWNTQWRDSTLFDSVFVPPVANDSGIAIGAAALAQFRETGRMKIAWDAYAGEEFVHEPVDFAAHGFIEQPLNYPLLCEWLVRYEMVVAWVQGRYEIGPNALCHRSLLAAPFARGARETLNGIRRRESFHPVDAVCLEAEMGKHFAWSGPNPHLLYAQRVKSRELIAITHADRSARVQSMTRAQDRRTTELLEAFRAKTGFGVLCNASLSFPDRGLINRSGELLRFARDNDIPVLVIDGRMYLSAAMQERLLHAESPVHGF